MGTFILRIIKIIEKLCKGKSQKICFSYLLIN